MSQQGIVVVGAGPVGCLTALGLRARGHEVLLLERGGWDSPRGPLLNAFGSPVLGIWEALGGGEALRGAVTTQARRLFLGSPGGVELAVEWPEGGGRTFFRRDRLDRALRAQVDAAGVRRQDRVRDVALEWRGGRVSGVRWTRGSERCAVGTSWVLACDGGRSKLAKQAGLEADAAGFEHSYRGQLYTGTDLPAGSFCFFRSPQKGLAVLVFSDDQAGPGAAYVEVEHRRHAGADAAGDPEQALAEALAATPLAAARVGAGRPEGPLKAVSIRGTRRRRLVAPGVVLLGDAAAVVDPIGSAGLLLGLYGVQGLLDAVGSRPAEEWALGAWEQQALDRVRGVSRFARLFRAGMDRPALHDLVFRVLAGQPARLRMLVDTYNGERGYSRFFDWRLLLAVGLGSPRWLPPGGPGATG